MRIVAIISVLCGLPVGLQAQVPDFTPQTPLIGALLHDDLAEARRLIDAGADPNQGRFVGFPPLLLAIVRQDVLETVYEEARTNRDRIPDPPIGVSYALLGLAAQQQAANQMTDALSAAYHAVLQSAACRQP